MRVPQCEGCWGGATAHSTSALLTEQWHPADSLSPNVLGRCPDLRGHLVLRGYCRGGSAGDEIRGQFSSHIGLSHSSRHAEGVQQGSPGQVQPAKRAIAALGTDQDYEPSPERVLRTPRSRPATPRLSCVTLSSCDIRRRMSSAWRLRLPRLTKKRRGRIRGSGRTGYR